MEIVENKKRKHISKWIYLSIAVLITSFIIVHSCLPAAISSKWSNVFVNFFVSIFNGTGINTTEIIDVNGLDLKYDNDYKYNNILGYKDNELVVGTSKRLEATISPNNATNTAVKFVSSNNDIATVRQDLNKAYVIAKSVGEVVITAYSESNNNYLKEYTFNVINPKAPASYSVYNVNVYEDSLFYLPIHITNDILSNDEKYQHYDISLLDVDIADSNIVSPSAIDDMYIANNIGNTTIKINNDKTIYVNVLDKSNKVLPVFNELKGNDIVYSGGSYHYEVDIDNIPSSNDVIYSVSNLDVASIARFGTLSVKDIKEEVDVVITATSVLDSSVSISKNVTIKPVTITSFELVIPYYGNHITNSSYSGETGQEIKVWMEDNTGTIVRSGVNVSSSNESVAKVYAQGSYIYIDCLTEGNTKIVVTSINNPNVSKYVDLEVVTKGVINHDNYNSFSEFVRKSIGHFLLFLVDGIFIFLLFYMLNKDIDYKHKKKWHYIVIVIFIGLFISGLSELVQTFVPTRYGSIIDVATDLVGFIVGAGITLLITCIVSRHKRKKKENNK